MSVGDCLVTTCDYLVLKQGKMIAFSLVFSLIFYLVQAEGEFIVIRSPPSVKFEGDEPIDQNLIPDICSASLGFTTKQESDWPGMKIVDPFNFAEAVVILYVDGIQSLGTLEDFPKFQLEMSRDEESTWNAIKNEIVKRFPSENNTLLRVELGLGSDELGDIKTKHLDKNIEEDANFLRELKDLEMYSSEIEKRDGVPDLYWYVLKSLHALNEKIWMYFQVSQTLVKLGNVFDKAYHGRALVAAIVSDASHTRRTRSALDDFAENAFRNDINMAADTNEDFPAIFNIILWFSVAFVLSLIAICVFIAEMDPGRDSIIYRMTSNRMKKDS
ncbi:UNVERIFIED_CONTAM: hypothetical protein PYX00_003157 [Menopon gallinae]|uniref:Renin receptor n=1 Tax=Menopon gallinae TaxID=328185 RepID=A0AAW2HZ70_9NEOP